MSGSTTSVLAIVRSRGVIGDAASVDDIVGQFGHGGKGVDAWTNGGTNI
jgi:hypothetical protein